MARGLWVFLVMWEPSHAVEVRMCVPVKGSILC